MNNTKILQAIVLVLAVVLVFFVLKNKPNAPVTEQNNTEQPTPQPVAAPNVIVDTPAPMSLVTSPLVVKGRAKGSWYFEANIPVTLKDGNGNILSQKGFHSIGDWMTTNYVEFADSLPFVTPQTQYGTLVISKDNPSGDPANDEDFPVPVRFW